ncbi:MULTISPECIES: tail fiber assembly protein [Citrobacter freundii complex]|uniref:Tail fiber assembly protein n=1 Tax=Citrobacter cronae TaxID=1748967 RepID=A0A7X1BTB8_9ENTR|nr:MULTISPECIES: tail fiber assembly protein [Citrobacter]MBC2622705.1 tail fiber assembly protein [Citrobacter cronae]HAT2585891.1 tail fiber assembly protein [Citrobacter freundii]HAU8243131.1 tail fiber assembly protein [Citrobacter freundii]HCD1231441.1 tail fiber assembly protein [Citrobacter freundii]HCD1309388.1 tail fiber assembly protein [Citrobacter freundii]
MQHLKNLKKYTPDDKESQLLIKEYNVEFLISDDGRDWYESQGSFSSDTLKIAYDEAGIIRSISNDVSSIYPRGFSVVEVDITKANKSVDIFGGWVFDNGEIKPRQYSQEELRAQAEAKKTELLSAAAVAIAPLEDAVDEGMATEEETAALSEWKKYRVKVRRVDTSKPEWPTPPNIQAT